ncbi:MAG: nucleoside hydrolase [Clostridia bacterium]|nr:nucleoside hydrolase [Clostridia bacterium]
MHEQYLIDTDPGDDIDDAFAITLAVKANLNIAGITTVFRNAAQRAKMTKMLLRLCGREDIPVRAGIDTPMVQKMQNLLPPEMLEREMKDGYYTLPQYLPEMDKEEISDEHAVDFIIRKARECGGNLVIIAIGPFSNVAMAVRKAPDIIPLIKEIRLIGGYYTKDIPEWNVACDPECARAVYTCGIPIKAIGLDLTLRCAMDKKAVERLRSFKEKTNILLSAMLEKWMAHYGTEKPIMHDPLVIAVILDPEIVEFEKKYVLVGLQGAERCKTVIQDGPSLENSMIEVGLEVHPEKFFEVFYKYIFN